MVIGATETGKSSACNFLLGTQTFKVGLGMMAVKSQSGSCTTVLNGRKVNIIDTPGFHKDSEDDKYIVEELDKAIVSAGNGVHAIAIVVSALEPFTSSQVTLEKLEFLDELWPFTFIIFSGAKSYGATDGKQRETIYKIYGSPKSYAKDFKKLLDKVDKQFMMLESTETSQDYRSTKLMEFFKMVDSIYYANQRLYSQTLFGQAIESYQNREKTHQEGTNRQLVYEVVRVEPVRTRRRCNIL